MKITFFIQDITTRGGTERTTCCLANEFSNNGHSVSIVSAFSAGTKVQYPLLQNVNLVLWNDGQYDMKMSFVKRFIIAISKMKKIRRTKEFQDADVILGQRIFASLLIFLSGLSKKSIACEHFKYGMYNSIIRFFRNLLYKRFERVVVLTERDRQRFRKHGVRNVCVIPNMISIVPIEKTVGEQKRIISVGRLDKQKGYDLLLKSLPAVFRQYPDWHLDIFGEGIDFDELNLLRKKLNLESNVFFKGFVKNIEEEYANSSFYVMSSRYEGFPMVLLEAMACGLPIVSFDCPEGPSVLLKDGGGILVKYLDIKALEESICTMISDKKLRDKMALEASNIVMLYKSEIIYNKWIKLFNDAR